MSRGKIGLYFGSFNPPTLSHLYVAQACCEETDVDEVWFVLSPQNPEKEESELLNFEARGHLLMNAITDFECSPNTQSAFYPEIIESELPKPSYTYRTIEEIRRRYGNEDIDEFVIIMGDDTYNNIKNWKNVENLFGEKVMVVPRIHPNGAITNKIKEIELKEAGDVVLNEYENPLTNVLNISSTIVRERIKAGKVIKGLVTTKVERQIFLAGYYLHDQ